MADGGWRCPKGDRTSTRKRQAPPSLKTLIDSSLSEPNFWLDETPLSPRKEDWWPERRPIFPWRYGNLRHPERHPPFRALVKSSATSSSERGIQGNPRRPLTAMMDRSGGLAGGEEADESTATPQVQVDLQRYPAVQTTSTGPAGGVEEAESPLIDLHETVSQVSGAECSLWCPFEMVGETWDQCVADVERDFIELEAQIRGANK